MQTRNAAALIARHAIRVLDRGTRLSVDAMVDALRKSGPAEVVLVHAENDTDRELVEMISQDVRSRLREEIEARLSVSAGARKFGIEENGWAYLATLMIEVMESTDDEP